MTDHAQYCVVLTATASADAAADLAQKIVAAKLAACVQVLPIQSYYVWRGEARNDAECLLIIKARVVQYTALEDFIRTHHAYEIPEIVQLPIAAGFSGYLRWMDEATEA